MNDKTRGVTPIPEIRPKKKLITNKLHIYIYQDDMDGAWFWEMQKRGALICVSKPYPDIGMAKRAAGIMQDSLDERVRGPIHYPENHNYSGGN